jgi:hypothetical protein
VEEAIAIELSDRHDCLDFVCELLVAFFVPELVVVGDYEVDWNTFDCFERNPSSVVIEAEVF